MSLVARFIGAAKAGDLRLLKECLEEGVDINSCDTHGETALHKAASDGQNAVVNYLCYEKNVDLNIQSGEGNTALHEAAKWGHQDVVTSLCEKNINVNIQKEDILSSSNVVYSLKLDLNTKTMLP